MKFQFNRDEVSAAAEFVWKNNPAVTQWPRSPRSSDDVYDQIVDDIRRVAKTNAKVYNDAMFEAARGDNKAADKHWTRWCDWSGTGGYLILSFLEQYGNGDEVIEFMVCVQPEFDIDIDMIEEEIV